MLSVPGIVCRCTFQLCGKWWLKGDFSVLVFLLQRPWVFTSLYFEPVKVMCTESKRHDWHYICLMVSPYSSTNLGVPMVGCPKTDGDWTHGEHGPRPSVSLLQDGVCSLSHLSGTCLRDPFLGFCVARAGQTLLLPGCLSGSWRRDGVHLLCPALGLLHLFQHCGKALAAAILSLLCSQTERSTFALWRRCRWHVRRIAHFL